MRLLKKSRAWPVLTHPKYRGLAEFLSTEREWECCSLIDRLLHPRASTIVQYQEGNLLMQDHTGFVFPLFRGGTPSSCSLKYPPGTIMGLKQHVTQFCDMARLTPSSEIEYHLMVRHPSGSPSTRHSSDVMIRRLTHRDHDAVLPLEAAYQKEEVLLPGHLLHMSTVTHHVSAMLEHQIGVGVFLKQELISKAHTNARGLRCSQLGGIYTLPRLRGSGWATAAVRELMIQLDCRRSCISLFVKPENHAGIRLYARLGFTTAGRYSIAYV